MLSDDIKTIADEFLKNPTQAQIDSLTKSCPEHGYDIETVRTILGLKDTVKVADVKRAFWDSRSKHQAETCGNCEHPWGIPILEWMQHRTTQNLSPGDYVIPGCIPQVYVKCPNCGGSQKAVTFISRMTEEEQAWCWIVLYDFVSYRLGQKLLPGEFMTKSFWPDIDIVPAFTAGQRALLDSIVPSKFNIYNPNQQLKKAVQGAVYQATVPF